MRRGEIHRLADDRNVLTVSLTDLDQQYGAVLAIVLHPPDVYPDTIMSVAIVAPIRCTAVAINITQLRVTRFDDSEFLGPVDPKAMERVDQALKAVLDL